MGYPLSPETDVICRPEAAGGGEEQEHLPEVGDVGAGSRPAPAPPQLAVLWPSEGRTAQFHTWSHQEGDGASCRRSGQLGSKFYLNAEFFFAVHPASVAAHTRLSPLTGRWPGRLSQEAGLAGEV